MKSSDGFDGERTKRPHQAPLKYTKKWPPTKKLLYFFIVAPGRRWNVKNEIKFFFLFLEITLF